MNTAERNARFREIRDKVEADQRLSLDDGELTQKLKDLRHDIVRINPAMQNRFLMARDSEGDVGADMLVDGEELTRNKKELVEMTKKVKRELDFLFVDRMDEVLPIVLDPETYKKTTVLADRKHGGSRVATAPSEEV